jgi:hypothetical protein
MNERDIFDEKQETKTANFACPNCRERNDYDVRWLKRTKKRNYMVRIDDQLMCKNIRCRKRFEIPSAQSIVFL